jgi:CBS-domain-containing membrane protein
MHLNNLSQLPGLTREKRMVGIVTLEDIAREQEAMNPIQNLLAE